jgi:hypothetical protein
MAAVSGAFHAAEGAIGNRRATRAPLYNLAPRAGPRGLSCIGGAAKRVPAARLN